MNARITKLIDINDYLTQNQSCVKSLVESVNVNGKEVKKITLNDCLSCSGCITTSESILVNNNSIENHFKIIKEEYSHENCFKIGILSYQSLESFLLLYKKIKNLEDNNMNYYTEIENIIAEILNIDYIIPLNNFILYTLNLCYSEFCEKNKKNDMGGMICSECTGWICYAEKKIGKISFPFLSNIKSPHEISSIIIKEMFIHYLKDKINIDKDLFICSIMPCFDKKIEPIKYNTGINSVISTIELEEKFEEKLKNEKSEAHNKIINIKTLYECLKSQKCSTIKEIKEYINLNIKNNIDKFSLYEFPFEFNYSSNFYIEFFSLMIQDKYKDCLIERKNGKNNDSKEIIIYEDETKKKILFKFLLSYGMRNINNIERKIKKKKIDYDFIEIMACPGGCLNGAGQIKFDKINKTREEFFNQISNELKKKEKPDLNLIKEKIKYIENIISELKIDISKFKQTFKETGFSKSDFDW